MNALKLLPLLFFSHLYSYEEIDFIGHIASNSIRSAISVSRKSEKIYVLSSSDISIYNSSFSLVSKIGINPGKYAAISIGEGRIYILDRSACLIYVYSDNGEFIFSFGSKGSGNGQLSNPSDLKYFNGKVYVASSGTNRLEVFSKDGVYLYGFSLVSRDGLRKISPSKIDIDKSGFIYLCDPSAGIIQKYDFSGKLINERSFQASAISVNSTGIVYCASEKDGKIRELGNDLSEISSFGTKGKGKFEFLSFADMEVDEKDSLMVIDPANGKIMFLKLKNSKYKNSLPDMEDMDVISIRPAEVYQVSAYSFAPIDEKNLLYYDSKTKKVYLLSESSKKEFLNYGEEEGMVKNPADMMFYSGKIYVADTGNSRGQIYSADGKYESLFGSKAGFLDKNKEGKFSSPVSIACDSKGKVYVADVATSLVQVFNRDGIFLFAIGPDLNGTKLSNITCINTDEEDKLYLLDSQLKKIFVFDSNGKMLSSWPVSNTIKPVSFSYDSMGYFYVLDMEKSNVSVYDKSGNYITSFFTRGKGIRELYEPVSLKIKNGKLFISDPVNSKIASYIIAYAPAKPQNITISPSQEKISISWSVSNPATVKKFEVYKGTNPEKMKKIADTRETSYEDNDLKPAATYYYRVASVSEDDRVFSDIMSSCFKGKEPEKEVETQEDLKNKPPVELIPVSLNYLFSANYKYYMENPVGRILVKNNTEEKFSNLKVSFFLKDYMDFPSDVILPELEPRTSSYVDLKATLNNRILTINEDTPVQAQISVSYYRDGKENETRVNKPVKILSKNAIVWDNAERIANFITVKDPPVYAFSRAILSQKSRLDIPDSIDDNLATAVFIWYNLSNYPVSYIPDPSNPYSSVKGSQEFITDTVQFPRNTLKLKSGDCDDLTVLIATLLESAGVSVKILDYPAHIALMFETQAEDISQVGLPDDLIVKLENKYYVPVETTVLGKSFYESVLYAAEMYKNAGGNVKVVDLKKAMTEFEPVTLPDTTDEFSLPAGDISSKISLELNDISNKRFSYYENLYTESIKANPEDMSAYINLGVLYATGGKLVDAQKVFSRLLEKDNENPAALNNMGNVFYLKKDYLKAIEYYEKAAKLDPFDENIFLNIARAYIKLGKKEDAAIFAQKAVAINPQVKSTASLIVQ